MNLSRSLPKLWQLSRRNMAISSKMLHDEHIIMSGGIGSIGLSTIKSFIEHGAKVSVVDVMSYNEASDRLLQETKINLNDNTQNVHYQQCDVKNLEQITNFMANAYNRFGPINTACIYSGVVSVTPILEETEEELRRILDNNIVGTFLFAQTAAKSMVEHTKSGNKHILFTSSTCAEDNQPGLTSYCSSKAAVNSLMRSFALELAQFDIRCNSIQPGIINSGMAKLYYETNEPYHNVVDNTILFKGMQDVEMTVDLFVYLCSASSKYATGTVYTIDGGAHLSSKNTVGIYYEGIKNERMKKNFNKKRIM